MYTRRRKEAKSAKKNEAHSIEYNIIKEAVIIKSFYSLPPSGSGGGFYLGPCEGVSSSLEELVLDPLPEEELLFPSSSLSSELLLLSDSRDSLVRGCSSENLG